MTDICYNVTDDDTERAVRIMISIPIQNKGFCELNPIVAGWERCASGHSYGPHTRDYYILHYVVSGNGVFEKEGKIQNVGEGEIFVIRPGEITTYTADLEKPWFYIWIGFDGRLAKMFDKADDVLSYGENTFLDIIKISPESSMAEEMITSKLFEIISVIFGGANREKCYEDIAYNHIKAKYMEKIRIYEIADMIGIDRSYLSRLFRKKYGMSVQDFLVDVRLAKAAEFLRKGTNVSISAKLVGYEDVFNFSKMFKKKYGVSPKEFKDNA